MSDGGTIIAVKGASAFLREKDVEISKLKPWEPPKQKDDDKTQADTERYNDFRVPGSAFRATETTAVVPHVRRAAPPAVLLKARARSSMPQSTTF